MGSEEQLMSYRERVEQQVRAVFDVEIGRAERDIESGLAREFASLRDRVLAEIGEVPVDGEQ